MVAKVQLSFEIKRGGFPKSRRENPYLCIEKKNPWTRKIRGQEKFPAHGLFI